MRTLDDQETVIAQALVRNPRISDNRLGEENDLPVRSVSRKRARLEADGVLRYFAEIDTSEGGTGHFPCRHMFIVRFRVGVTPTALAEEIRSEPNVVTVFTRSIYESFIAEVDGRVALVLVIAGTSDADVVERFQEQIIPSLEKNHGKGSVEDIDSIRLLSRVRLLRNYLPDVNMEGGKIREGWRSDAVYIA